MKKSALIKDIFRNISNSKGRFISIVIIIALGVAFFSGLKKAPEDMKYTADKYYSDYNLFDIRIVSTLGLTEDDLKSISQIDEVSEVRGTYFIDAIVKEGENDSVFRIFGFDNKDQINGYRLIEGRLPEKDNECLIEKGLEDELRFDLGSKIKLKSGTSEDIIDNLKNTEYTVVGAVQSPYYLSFEKGNSSIGNGRVSGYIVVPESNFVMDAYTDIYVKVKESDSLNSYNQEYFDLIDPVVEKIDSIAPTREKIRYESLIESAENDLAEAEDRYDKSRIEAKNKLEKAKDKITQSQKRVEKGFIELKKEEQKFHDNINIGRDKIENAKIQLDKGYAQYEESLKKYKEESEKFKEIYNQSVIELDEVKKKIEELKQALIEIDKGINNPYISEEELESLKIEYNEKNLILSSLIERVSIGEEELKQGQDRIENVKYELEQGKIELDNNYLKIKLEEEKLDSNEKLGKAELEKNRKKLEKARRDLLKGEEEYNKSEKETIEKLNQAWEKIEEGQRDIKKIEKSKWYVLDRKSHYSYVDYEGAADRIDALSKVFPVFFALVAALVCLTSMTRMVDEQRVNIGTLKALGYSNIDIALKYIIYALIASIVGCIIGFAVGYTLFPVIIFNAYGLMYVLPPIVLSFNYSLAIKISIVAILLTTITTYIACINELKENSASLMRPKAPKAGKRILLERIPFIWNKFNFSNKVTLRNIFRYKRRFFMTVFGIAGCSALILAGFGIKDSIKTVVNRQYGDLFKYDLEISLEDNNLKYIDQEDDILEYTALQSENGYLRKNSLEKDIIIIVPNELEKFPNFVELQTRLDNEKLQIPEEGMIITEQVSKSLNLNIGDEVLVVNNDDDEAIAKITGITENYTFNYAYLSKDYYRDIFMKKPKINTVYANLVNNNKEIEDKVSKNLMLNEGISRINFNSVLKEDFNEVIDTLDFIIVVMIVFAGALAFVVLYNLSNVNISERHREIATIKVLGFYDKEVSAYIYRENIILTVIGSLLGLIMGIYLHRFIMTTVEMDNIMFGLKLDSRSYLYAIVLTSIFSILVNITMHFKLKNIEMVESLKSVD